MILGIDTGVGKRCCGIALVVDGKLFRHKTVDGCKAIEYAKSLYSVYRFDRCVIEKPRLAVIYARHSTKSNRVIGDAGRNKIAMNVGQNIQLTNDITRELEKIGVKVKQVPPKSKATKWPVDYWRRIFGWEGRAPSSHARDASVIALQYENWAGWSAPE